MNIHCPITFTRLSRAEFDELSVEVMGHGDVEDHVHLLVSLPSTLTTAKALQLLKGNSSKWIHETFPDHWDFGWQEGYDAFSIGVPRRDESRRDGRTSTWYRTRMHMFASEWMLLGWG